MRRLKWSEDSGFAASANYGDDFALFEPVHGCAPDLAGKGNRESTFDVLYDENDA